MAFLGLDIITEGTRARDEGGRGEADPPRVWGNQEGIPVFPAGILIDPGPVSLGQEQGLVMWSPRGTVGGVRQLEGPCPRQGCGHRLGCPLWFLGEAPL